VDRILEHVMKFVANRLNKVWPSELVSLADSAELKGIDLAVAYASDMTDILDLATKRLVSLRLFALLDAEGFPDLKLATRLLTADHTRWKLYFLRDYYHPKVMWFRGVGCYVGSANLSERAWKQNLEAGLWLSEAELAANGLTAPLNELFTSLSDEYPARRSDLLALQRLEGEREKLSDARRTFDAEADRILAHIPKGRPLTFEATREQKPAEQKEAFRREWGRCVQILQTLRDRTRSVAWPDWVDKDVPPAIAFDQATEYWYTVNVRDEHTRDATVEDLHQRHRANPDRAADKLLAEWSAFDGDHGKWEWATWCNENPRRLRELLPPAALRRLNLDALEEIVWLSHSARTTARQIPYAKLGLPRAQRSERERCRLFAEFLLRQRPERGERTVQDVLLHVLWGRPALDHAGRLWDATELDDWKLDHLDVGILGELLGYARPEECPRRNHRVSRCLRALGYDVAVPEKRA
jgi:hypothetical protein